MHIKQVARLPGMCRHSMNMNCLGNSKGRWNLFELRIEVISLRHHELAMKTFQAKETAWIRNEDKWSSRAHLIVKLSYWRFRNKWGIFVCHYDLRGAVGVYSTKAKQVYIYIYIYIHTHTHTYTYSCSIMSNSLWPQEL